MGWFVAAAAPVLLTWRGAEVVGVAEALIVTGGPVTVVEVV